MIIPLFWKIQNTYPEFYEIETKSIHFDSCQFLKIQNISPQRKIFFFFFLAELGIWEIHFVFSINHSRPLKFSMCVIVTLLTLKCVKVAPKVYILYVYSPSITKI